MSPCIDFLFVARIVAVCALAAGVVACDRKGDAQAPAAAAAQQAPMALPVTVIKASAQRVPNVIEAVGQTEGSKDIEVRARVSGILEKTLYNEGDRVKAGAVLFQIDRAPFENALAQARAQLAQSRASLVQERAKLEQANREAARLKPLVEQRAISQREYEDATTTARTQDAAIAGAEGRIRDSEAKLRDAELNLSYTNVVAPVGGITGRAQRSIGNLITAGTDSSLLTTISQPDPIWVRFSVSDADYATLREAGKNTQVRVVLPNGNVYAVVGKLNFVSSSVDTKTGTIQLRGEFRNPDAVLLPGQFVKTRLYAGEVEGTLVPQVAIVQNDQGRFVWVAGADGKAALKPIEGSSWIGRDWLITKGIVAGDQVIVDNLLKLRPGAPVAPKEAAPATAGAAGVPGNDPATGGTTAPSTGQALAGTAASGTIATQAQKSISQSTPAPGAPAAGASPGGGPSATGGAAPSGSAGGTK